MPNNEKIRHPRSDYWKEWAAKNKEKRKLIAKRYQEKNKEALNLKRISKLYKITEEELNSLRLKQNNRCAICNSEDSNTKKQALDIDHCHETGRVRGLLCNTCNRAIGLLQDNSELVQKAADYLKNNNKE